MLRLGSIAAVAVACLIPRLLASGQSLLTLYNGWFLRTPGRSGWASPSPR